MQNFSSLSVSERLLNARILLALEHHFLATAVMRLPFKDCTASGWCQTMATDGYHIFYNSEWVIKLTQKELIGLIAHEVLHVVFGHSDRIGSRNHHVWNIACDHAINLLLDTCGFNLPKDGYKARVFTNLSAERIYDEIYVDDELIKKYQIISSIGISSSELSPIIISPSGDILLPDDIRTANDRDKFSPDLQERKELRQSLLGELTEKLKGNSAGKFNQELHLADSRRVDWKTLLRRWLFERIRGDWKTYPFSKKHIWRNIYLPSVALDVPSHVVLAIDTSGSVPDSELSKVFIEVQNYRDIFPSQLTVIQCDAKIQHIQEYESEDYAPAPKKVTVLGRGGTDFKPVFDWIKEQHFVSLPILIYATDGYGKFPEIQPNFPVIWIAFKKSIELKKFPFGEVIELDSSFNLCSTHKLSQ